MTTPPILLFCVGIRPLWPLGTCGKMRLRNIYCAVCFFSVISIGAIRQLIFILYNWNNEARSKKYASLESHRRAIVQWRLCSCLKNSFGTSPEISDLFFGKIKPNWKLRKFSQRSLAPASGRKRYFTTINNLIILTSFERCTPHKKCSLNIDK